MFARKDIERDVLSDYREHGRHMRTQKEPGKTSEWPRVFVEEVKLETPEPPRPRPVESIILRGVSRPSCAYLDSSHQCHEHTGHQSV